MSSSLVPKTVGAVEMISYYSHTRLFAGTELTTGTCNFDLFGDTASGDGIDIDRGQLPNNASGHLRYVGFQFGMVPSATAATQLASARCIATLAHALKAEVIVNGISILEAPISMFGSPAPVLQGIADSASSTTSAPYASGPMQGAAMLDHPIGSNQRVIVRVKTRWAQAVTSTTMRPAASSDIFIHCVLGVALARALVATK